MQIWICIDKYGFVKVFMDSNFSLADQSDKITGREWLLGAIFQKKPT